MEGWISRVLSESRIIADLSDFADFKVCMRRGFVIKLRFFVRITDFTEDTENAEKEGFG